MECVHAAIRGSVENEAGHQEQLAIFRHILGDPFHPYDVPSAWPNAVIALAEAIYHGDSAANVPLHDALLECGHSRLAKHVIDTPIHPKGCWVLDLLTGP